MLPCHYLRYCSFAGKLWVPLFAINGGIRNCGSILRKLCCCKCRQLTYDAPAMAVISKDKCDSG